MVFRLSSEQELQNFLKGRHAKVRNHTPRKTTHLEPDCSHEIERPNEIKAFDSPVNVTVHSYRYRLCDPDGISVKWALDAIVKAGILVDDKPENVKEVRFKQSKIPKTEDEKTVITLEAVEEG